MGRERAFVDVPHWIRWWCSLPEQRDASTGGSVSFGCEPHVVRTLPPPSKTRAGYRGRRPRVAISITTSAAHRRVSFARTGSTRARTRRLRYSQHRSGRRDRSHQDAGAPARGCSRRPAPRDAQRRRQLGRKGGPRSPPAGGISPRGRRACGLPGSPRAVIAHRSRAVASPPSVRGRDGESVVARGVTRARPGRPPDRRGRHAELRLAGVAGRAPSPRRTHAETSPRAGPGSLSAACRVSGVTRQRTLSMASAASGVRARIARPASIVAWVRWQAA